LPEIRVEVFFKEKGHFFEIYQPAIYPGGE